MTMSSPLLSLLLDHDNIALEDVDVRKLIHSWLDRIAERLPPSGVLTILARAYGGWFLGDHASDARFKAMDFYQNAFPSVMMHKGRFIRLSFEFADFLLGVPDPVRITHTVVSRASPQYVTVQSAAPACAEQDCELKAVRTWIRRRRACAKPGCPHGFESFFERREQKQVDVHIAVDLLSLVNGSEGADRHIALATDDADLLPSVIAAAASRNGKTSLTLVRALKHRSYIDSALESQGVEILFVNE